METGFCPIVHLTPQMHFPKGHDGRASVMGGTGPLADVHCWYANNTARVYGGDEPYYEAIPAY